MTQKKIVFKNGSIINLTPSEKGEKFVGDQSAPVWYELSLGDDEVKKVMRKLRKQKQQEKRRNGLR